MQIWYGMLRYGIVYVYIYTNTPPLSSFFCEFWTIAMPILLIHSVEDPRSWFFQILRNVENSCY